MRKLWCIGLLCVWSSLGQPIPSVMAQQKPSFQRVLYMLKHPYWKIKWQGLCLLERYYAQHKNSVTLVGQILIPPNPRDEYATTAPLRQRALRWLATSASPEAWSLLLKAVVSESSFQVRLLLVKTLGYAPVLQKQALQSLRLLHTHPHPTLQKAAKQAWKRLYLLRST